MLRSVNLGAHNRVKMELLRDLCGSLGLSRIETCLQSGNVVFQAKTKDLAGLPKRIEKAVEQQLGFRTVAVLRTPAQLRDVFAANPFAKRPGLEPAKLLVTFLSGDPDQDGSAKVLAMKIAPEELRIHGREIYTYFPDGMARPKSSMLLIEKTLRTQGTGRNWNTVTKLLAMAEKLEGDVG